MKNLHISREMFSFHHIILSENISIMLLSWTKKLSIFVQRVMKFGSGWVIIIMDICFEMSLDLYWYDLISSHNTNIKQNLFLTDLWSSFRTCHLHFLYCYVVYIAYVIICLLWNKFILLSHVTQIRRHPLHYHFNVMKKFSLPEMLIFMRGKRSDPAHFSGLHFCRFLTSFHK